MKRILILDFKQNNFTIILQEEIFHCRNSKKKKTVNNELKVKFTSILLENFIFSNYWDSCNKFKVILVKQPLYL